MPDFPYKVRIVDVLALKDSGRALLCKIEDEDVWIPHSQIDDESEVFHEGDTGVLVISEWIAERKGLA